MFKDKKKKSPPQLEEDRLVETKLKDANTSNNKPKFRISTTVKSIDGDTIKDHTLSEILARSSNRADAREPDTPLSGKGVKAKPKAGFPNFKSDNSDHVVFNPDAITTPHTYAKVTAPGSPRGSAVAQKIYTLLRKSWDPYANAFDYRNHPLQIKEFQVDLLALCSEISSILEGEPAFLQLDSNIFVFGDMHGNFGDLYYFLSELLLFNDIEMTPYSFLTLGDYVDRGEYSVECVAICLALKCLSPSTFFMLRGNHEDPGINGDTDTYGMDCFQAQSRALFGEDSGMQIWQAINGVFKLLPLAATIDNKIFCSHGGIPRYYGPSEQDDRLTLLKCPDFPRFRSLFEPLDMSVHGKEKMERFWVAAFDLMWSDPSDDDSEMNEYGFGRSDRGNCIITFSEVAVDNFLTTNGFDLMFRAHQEKSDGLKISKSAKCLTIFSSSNYQGHGNGAGVVYVSNTGKIKMIMKEPN